MTLFTYTMKASAFFICSFLPPSSPPWTCHLFIILIVIIFIGGRKPEVWRHLLLYSGPEPNVSLVSISESQTGFSHPSQRRSCPESDSLCPVPSSSKLSLYDRPCRSARTSLPPGNPFLSPQGLRTYCCPHWNTLPFSLSSLMSCSPFRFSSDVASSETFFLLFPNKNLLNAVILHVLPFKALMALACSYLFV